MLMLKNSFKMLKMAASTRRKGNLPTLLVGMQAGATTLENSMEVPQKAKNRATL